MTAASLDSSTSGNKQKAERVIFTKSIRFDDVMNGKLGKGRLSKGDGSPDENEPIALTLPEGVTDVGAQITGDQSGFVTSERIALEPGQTHTLFLDVETLPQELAVHAEESPVNLSLYTPIPFDTAQEETGTSSQKSRNKADGSGSETGDMLVWAIDSTTGKLTPTTKIRSGYGGEGSMGSVSDDGGLGFITQKGKPEGAEFSGYIRAKDGSMKPLTLPEGSDPTTLARDGQSGMLYLLKPTEDRLMVQKPSESGSLTDVEQITTGRYPSMIYLMPGSRLLLVTNQGDKTVSVFKIDLNGMLTLNQTVQLASNPTAIETGAAERFVYITQEKGGISQFTVDPDSQLMTFIDMVEASADLAIIKIDSTTQFIVGLPQSETGGCSQDTPCRSKSRLKKLLKKAVAVVASVVKNVVVSVIKTVVCAVGSIPTTVVLPLGGVGPVCMALLSIGRGDAHFQRDLLKSEVDVKLSNNVSERWQVHLDVAIADWSQSNRLNLKKVSGTTNPRSCKFTLGQISVCSADFGPTDWVGLGIGIPWNDHLITGYAIMNEYYFQDQSHRGDENYAVTNDTPAMRQSVMCQEIGHALGLLGRYTHRDEDNENRNLGTCMDYTFDPAGTTAVQGPLNNEHPDAIDFNRLSKNHDHIDGGMNIIPYIFDALKFIQIPSHKKAFGSLKKSSRNGRLQLYELDLGRGLKMSTHVTRPRSVR